MPRTYTTTCIICTKQIKRNSGTFFRGSYAHSRCVYYLRSNTLRKKIGIDVSVLVQKFPDIISRNIAL